MLSELRSGTRSSPPAPNPWHRITARLGLSQASTTRVVSPPFSVVVILIAFFYQTRRARFVDFCRIRGRLMPEENMRTLLLALLALAAPLAAQNFVGVYGNPQIPANNVAQGRT